MAATAEQVRTAGPADQCGTFIDLLVEGIPFSRVWCQRKAGHPSVHGRADSGWRLTWTPGTSSIDLWERRP